MDILIETSTGIEVNRWGNNPGKVKIPGSNDVVFCMTERPIDIGPNHFLATATVIEPALGAYQKRGPETVDVVGRSVTVTRPAINKPASAVKEQKYIEANAEYIKRGIILTGTKVRGSAPDQVLTAAAMKETQRGGAKAGPLATLHDRLDTLKDAIEIAADPSIINVTDNGYWV